MNSRPQTLAEAVERSLKGGRADPHFREFLDTFYSADAAKQQAMIAQEPPWHPDARVNAYAAAVAEHLGIKFGLDVSPWVSHPDRFLTRPFFPAGLESLKATLLVESPPSFKRRMIFVEADPLYRPRRAQMPASWVVLDNDRATASERPSSN